MLLFDFPHYRVSKRHGSTFVSPQVLKENILVLCIILPGNLILLMTSLFYWRMLLEYIYIYILHERKELKKKKNSFNSNLTN
jgi:hypothetical protein